MLKIKNRLIITVICLIFGIISNNALAENAYVKSISDKMIILVQDSDITYELSDTYIPTLILPETVKKANELADGKEFTFSNRNQNPGRHGSFYTTPIRIGTKKSLQEMLLENGLALVYFLDSPTNSTLLFAAEERARKLKLGIWKDGNLKTDNTALTNGYKQSLGKFIIVSGIVNNTYISKKNTYINFGKDWKTDFTVQLENKILKRFPEFSAEKLKGKKISVRGWLEDYNGPFMKIYHPVNIQIISGK
jgi:micrococcal nuclease